MVMAFAGENSLYRRTTKTEHRLEREEERKSNFPLWRKPGCPRIVFPSCFEQAHGAENELYQGHKKGSPGRKLGKIYHDKLKMVHSTAAAAVVYSTRLPSPPCWIL